MRHENGLRAKAAGNERRVGATARCLQWHWDSQCRRRRLVVVVGGRENRRETLTAGSERRRVEETASPETVAGAGDTGRFQSSMAGAEAKAHSNHLARSRSDAASTGDRSRLEHGSPEIDQKLAIWDYRLQLLLGSAYIRFVCVVTCEAADSCKTSQSPPWQLYHAVLTAHASLSSRNDVGGPSDRAQSTRCASTHGSWDIILSPGYTLLRQTPQTRTPVSDPAQTT
ncbi:hypothetical protein K491DRAFT_717033 [Lophiostoma macrostomum CBS 122681]|uniref:Uncharacterized protein n=1 Tax=Lophiostoma macrostomum CBS 122681 TaxID=1314788 RepID=A0A6A6T6V4_9PLEO|nr:hypothetical protein K491DRAFT_717033 [Lophiostoma macrostomum CBS 122681]